jgi:hypothetical protein
MRLKLEEKSARDEPSSDMFVVEGATGGDHGFEDLLGLMGDHGLMFYRAAGEGKAHGSDGLIPEDAVVIVKVKSQWDERGGTNTDLVRSVIEAILAHPDGFTGEIVVADNGQAKFGAHGYGGSLDYDRNNAEDTDRSIQVVVDSFPSRKFSTYLWDRITTNKVEEYFYGDSEDGYILDEGEDPTRARAQEEQHILG